MAGLNDVGFRGGLNPGKRTPEELEAEAAANVAASYGDFGGGLASAARGMVGSTKAYAASGLEALGADNAAKGLYAGAAEDAARAGVLAPEIATTDQITDGSTLGRYVAGKLGSAAGSLPPALLGGVAGRLATRSAVGAGLGAGAAYQPVMAGGHVQEINANPNLVEMDPAEKFARATGVGTLQAGVEGLGPAYIANRFFKRNAPATTVGGAARNFGTDVLKGSALEGGGAAVSDVVGQGGMMQADPTVAFDGRQTFEAGVGEAVGGAGFAVPGAAVANTLDYLDAGKTAFDAAKGAAQNVADAGALFKNTASGYLKHPELAKLVAAQTVPPELEGATSGEIQDWLASDSNDRRDAALKIAQRTLIDREASETEKATAQALLDNPNDPESWKPFADGMIAKHQIERLGSKIGQAGSQLAGWVGKVGKKKSNLESTPEDAEFNAIMRDPLAKSLGTTDEASLSRAAALLNDYVMSGFAVDSEGEVRVPDGLVDALGEQAPAILLQTYDTLRRQGRTRAFDATAKERLAAVGAQVKARQSQVKDAAEIVGQQLTPTMFRQVPESARADIADGVRVYLRSGKKDDETEKALDEMFGPNKDVLIEQMAALDKTPQSSLGRGPVDEASIDKPVDEDSKLRAVDGETGSDAQTELGEEYNSGINELNTDGGERYLFKGQKNQAFDTEDAFLDKNIDLARQGVDPKGRRLEYNKMTSSDQLKVDRMGVMDYASETGDRKQLDELIAKYPHLSHEEINQRFFVLKNEASEVDQGEAVDVSPDELNIAQGKKGSWQARTRIDSRDGNKDVSTLDHGRLYLSGDGIETPFVTSARTIIEQMWKRKTRGAFDEKTSDQTGAADKMAMFASGLTSLMDAGGFTKIKVKTPDGKMFQVDSLEGLPEAFAVWDSNDEGAKLTVGEARAVTSKRVRTERAAEMTVVRDDKGPLIFGTQSQAQAAARKGQMAAEHPESGGWAVYKAKGDAPSKAGEPVDVDAERVKRAKERGKGEAATGARTRLHPEAKPKADASEEAVQSARGVESRMERVEAGAVSETEEMAANKAAEFENTERRFDELTGLELQPRDKSTKGYANLLQQRVTKLRAEYKELAAKVAEYEAREGKNAIREAALKHGREKLAALVEQGRKLAAELAKLPPVEPKPTSTRAKEAAAELKRKDAKKPAFLRDTQGKSASTPAADAKAAKDIAYLEATIAAYHGEKTAAGAYEAVTLPDHAALDQIAKAFGARVRGFKVAGDKAKYGFFSGVYQGGNRDVVYLSDAAKRPHMALLGHELVHRLRKTNPALYAKFEAAVSKHIKPEAYKAWSKMFPETGDKLREEFMAEVVSDGMMDRTFWEALAKRDANLAKQVYASVMRLFKQIMASVGYTAKTKSVLDDYTAVMRIAGEVMAEHGVTPEVVKFSMESLENPTGQVMTAEQKAEVSSYIEKVLGPKVATIVTDQLKGSGEWSRDANNQNATIKIATTALNPLSVAHHEAMHEFFQRLLDGKYERAANVLRNAADSPLIKRQLQRHFAGQDAVLEQIENDVEERIAYMFQLWASGKLDIGTQTETVFRKIINVIRKTLGLVSQEKQLEEILQSFNDGKMAEPSAMAQVLDSQEARIKYLKKIGAKANPALKKANEWVGFAENALTGSKNPHLDAVGRTLNNKTGSKRDAQGFLSAKEQANNLYMNKFANALRGIDPTGKDTSVATKADVDLALEGLQTKTWHKDPLVLRIQQQVAGVFEEMMQYMKDAGVKVFNPETKKWDEVREIKDYRIPRSWDPAKIIEHSGRFKEMLLENHEVQLTRIAKNANDEIANGKDAGDYTASWEKREHGDKTPVTAEDVATAIVNRLINSNGQNELKESSTALGFSPFAKSVNEQTLDWIDEKLFAEFMEKDITKIISTYVGQVTKRGEYSRRFGADGEVLQKAMDEALKWEIEQIKEDRPDVSDEDAKSEAVQNLEPARRAIMAMEGTLGHDISVLARKASAYTIVYQNVRLLGYALFANLIDPLGMMVRGAEFKDAYGAFKRGIRDVTREWGDLTGVRKAKDSDRDDAVRVAEMIGTVDSSGFMSQMGTIYSSQYLPEWAKNVNDTFFRWNGLEAFNKSMRVGATQAAIGFIKRHYESPNEHSDRYFEELGLTRADVQLGPDGALNVENRQVQQAVMRWVDGAILRPNAAIRPTMSSDPHYAVFYHLKQFMYAMHAVILKRVQIEIKNGNTDPLILLLAGYVPMMLAADSAKGLIQEATGNGQPYWQHDSLGGVVAHGVERAGLLGVGQLLADTVNYGPLGLLGPAVEQAAGIVTEPLSESVAEATMVGPLSMVLRGPESSEVEAT